MGNKAAAYNPKTGQITAFYDSVDSPAPSGATVVALTNDEWRHAISTPGCIIVNGALTDPVPPTDGELLAAAHGSQLSAIYAGYKAAVTTDVSFTNAAGTAQTYQADQQSQTTLMQAVQGYDMAGAVPSGFYWVAADNTQVPFTLDDLKGLYGAMLAQGWTAFQNLQDKKAEIRDATTVADVEAVNW